MNHRGEVPELVERAGFENQCTRKGTEGSNPSLSAIPAPRIGGLESLLEAVTRKGLPTGAEQQGERRAPPHRRPTHRKVGNEVFEEGVSARRERL